MKTTFYGNAHEWIGSVATESDWIARADSLDTDPLIMRTLWRIADGNARTALEHWSDSFGILPDVAAACVAAGRNPYSALWCGACDWIEGDEDALNVLRAG
jgi:hypothetical protein